MPDDPSPSPPPPEPLTYWHSTDPLPLHPAVLALCLVAGLLTSAGVVAFVGGFTALTMMDIESSRQKNAPIIAVTAAVWGLIAVASVIGFGHRVRRGRSLAIERRRRAWRFFSLGLLLGCGIACLLEGICFAAGAAS